MLCQSTGYFLPTYSIVVHFFYAQIFDEKKLEPRLDGF